MFNFGRIVDVCFEELGQSGAEAVNDAINFYLANVPVTSLPCSEDVIDLYSLARCFDVQGFNTILPEFDCLRGKMRHFSSDKCDTEAIS